MILGSGKLGAMLLSSQDLKSLLVTSWVAWTLSGLEKEWFRPHQGGWFIRHLGEVKHLGPCIF